MPRKKRKKQASAFSGNFFWEVDLEKRKLIFPTIYNSESLGLLIIISIFVIKKYWLKMMFLKIHE